jgi:hypothetical protein
VIGLYADAANATCYAVNRSPDCQCVYGRPFTGVGARVPASLPGAGGSLPQVSYALDSTSPPHPVEAPERRDLERFAVRPNIANRDREHARAGRLSIVEMMVGRWWAPWDAVGLGW